MDMLDRMLEHDRWATLTLLVACEGLTDAQLDQEFDIGHRTLRATIDHQINNFVGWTAMMEHVPPADDGDTSGLNAFRRRIEPAYDRFMDFAGRARDEGRLDDTFSHHIFGSRHTIGATILHVVLHDEWHRSEIAHILQRLGVDPVPEVDLALWNTELIDPPAGGPPGQIPLLRPG
ncbi:MAG TPA: DinB family protein [Thermomicrobiales bacterium]|jgi:uncharacterized damage-inducible protein DinB|nr:DinB family protein [Thermomicrobiales bacterium]